ncbi:hypothetical protein CCP1ISM_170001 [Azospirillaceae bacterium]
MIKERDIIKGQMCNIEIRNLPSLHQDVIAIWLNLISQRNNLPCESDFYGGHFDVIQCDFMSNSDFSRYKSSLLVMARDADSDSDWRYLFKGQDIMKKIHDDERQTSITKVSEITNFSERSLIIRDLDTLTLIQRPHHRRLIWRPYTGYFGSVNERKSFIRIGLPIVNQLGCVSTCMFIVTEALFDGRAVIEAI